MEEAGETQQLGFVAGVVERERILGFERMLWRISRGNVFLRQADIETPFTDPKTVRLFFDALIECEGYLEFFWRDFY